MFTATLVGLQMTLRFSERVLSDEFHVGVLLFADFSYWNWPSVETSGSISIATYEDVLTQCETVPFPHPPRLLHEGQANE